MLGCAATLAGLSGLAGAGAPTYWWYMAARVCSGVAAAGMTLAGRALATEPIGPSWRGVAGVTTCFFTILGGLFTVLLAFLVGLFSAKRFTGSIKSCNALQCHAVQFMQMQTTTDLIASLFMIVAQEAFQVQK